MGDMERDLVAEMASSLYGAVTTGGNWKSVFTKHLAEIHSAFGTDPLSGDAQVERLAVAYAEALKSYPPTSPLHDAKPLIPSPILLSTDELN